MKEKILQVMGRELSVAEDNLHRAEMRFDGFSYTQLGEEYGHSGCSCNAILGQYKLTVAELKDCITLLQGKL